MVRHESTCELAATWYVLFRLAALLTSGRSLLLLLLCSPPRPARYGHTVAASGSNLVLMGGINWWNASDATHNLTDVWSSADLGATWTQLWKVAPFGIRHGATSVLVSDAILLIAGDSLDAATEGDVWSSSDLGVSWSEVNSAAFSARSFHTSTVDIETGTIVVASGLSAAGVPLNDVYTSTDSGVTWTTATSDAEFSARYGASSFWRKSVVYIVGGVTITDGVVEATNDMSDQGGDEHACVLRCVELLFVVSH